jgi:hypothetical protein
MTGAEPFKEMMKAERQRDGGVKQFVVTFGP